MLQQSKSKRFEIKRAQVISSEIVLRNAHGKALSTMESSFYPKTCSIGFH